MVLVMTMSGMMLVSFLGVSQEMVFLLMLLVLYHMTFGFSSMEVVLCYMFSYDAFSWCLVVLSLWIGSLMYLASLKNQSKRVEGGFSLLVISMILLLCLTFMVDDFMLFYIFFEASLVPVFLLIMGWGYQPERLQAGYYLIFYTLFGSLPLLLMVMYMMYMSGSLSFFVMNLQFDSVLLFLGVILGFLIKMPMFLIHLWLPKAHVEAPISGSMILAGVLLKLGGYGLVRVMSLTKGALLTWNSYLISLSLVSFTLLSLLCLRQYDLSALIAYSSVAHMSIVIGGLMTHNSWGVKGSLVMMLGHGLCSSGLFCLSNMTYERVMSRSMMVCKGLLMFFPNLSMWWFLLVASNMAAPPSMNLLGEIGLMVSILSWSHYCMVLLMLGSFFSGCYCIYLYSITQHGSGLYYYPMSGSSSREMLLLLLHWLPLNVLFTRFDFLFLLQSVLHEGFWGPSWPLKKERISMLSSLIINNDLLLNFGGVCILYCK